MQIAGTAFPGAKDARPFEQQGEVLTFTTEPLKEPVEWTGRVRAELFVSSTARDTDFIVRISDVYPDGRSILICDYPWRARYREGFDHQALLEPGKVHKLAFDVGWISQIFTIGHRIRVTISSTGAPLYEPNPQTGGEQTIDFPKDAVKAENTIYHNRSHASRIIAPVATFVAPVSTSSQLRYIPRLPQRTLAAVLVGDLPLVHTSQLLPDVAGSPAEQIDNLFSRLDAALRTAGSDPTRLVKLNCYLPNDAIVPLIEQQLDARFSGIRRPATSYVVTTLPKTDAMLALDGIAATGGEPLGDVKHLTDASILAAGSRLYVSGQAEKADTLREATRKTLESLTATLKHCGRTNSDIVQLKCFFQPMESFGEVRDEINRYFQDETTPPITFVEWKAASPPIEIELVAWGGPANENAKEVLEFITPPGMTASPLYSRVVRINRGGTIFIGDIATTQKETTDKELQAAFFDLGNILATGDRVHPSFGSDFDHLVKATYYVTDDEISKAHNTVRPQFYNAARPPAASKAIVAGTGHSGSRYVMDMIAVPTH
jgi:enamine deaminase RidA (YjgF/YER057c/UK114 family)